VTRTLLFIALCALSPAAGAQCKTSLPLNGIESVRNCDPKAATCVEPQQAVVEYGEKMAGNDDPAHLNMFVHASPWRFYDPDFRILTAGELAATIKPWIAQGVKRVQLVASWSGVRPEPGTPSLAEQVGKALGDTPVSGADGFLWIAPGGNLRTTRQAGTVMQGGRYLVAQGDEVFVSLGVGWPANFFDEFARDKNAEGVLRAAAGWDLYMLCPDRALQAFEYGARLNHPIAAYNAALMRLDRSQPGDVEAATALLSRAANTGDARARARLEALRSTGR